MTAIKNAALRDRLFEIGVLVWQLTRFLVLISITPAVCFEFGEEVETFLVLSATFQPSQFLSANFCDWRISKYMDRCVLIFA